MRTVALLLAMAAGAAHADGFTDVEFNRAALRTEYAAGIGSTTPLQLRYDQAGIEGCMFDAIATEFGCAGRAGTTTSSAYGPSWLGLMQRAPACRGSDERVGDTWRGCLTYRHGTPFALNASAQSHWIVLANVEPSFDQCRSGPPNLSEPVGVLDPGAPYAQPQLFKVGTERLPKPGRHRVHMMVNADAHDFRCASAGPDAFEGIPFLSVGAVDGRGNTGPLARFRLDAPASPSLQFEAQLLGYQQFQCPRTDCPAGASDCYCASGRSGARAGVALMSDWNGGQRMLMLELFGAGVHDSTPFAPLRVGFNWPIADSVLFPGGDIVVLTSQQIARDCPQLALPALSTRMQRWTIDVRAAFACAASTFADPPPANAELIVDQIHWYVESYGTRGHFWWALQRPRIEP